VKQRLKSLGLSLVLVLGLAPAAQAEYRAYLLEVYDHILQKKWDAATGFDPSHYIAVHGGGNRLSVLLKATWHCYGDTSQYTPTCPMPETHQGLFKVGDQVEVTLDKHMTQGWKGVVELALWRDDLRANVYGVRFGAKKQMFGRYFEFNLKATNPPPPAATGNPETPAVAPALPALAPLNATVQAPGAPAAATPTPNNPAP